MLAEPMTLYKLMNLYMLHQVNFPLTNAQLSNFFLDREYTTYFTLQQALNELLDAGLVKKETMRNSYMLSNTVTLDGYQVNGDGAWVVNGVVQTKGRDYYTLEEASQMALNYHYALYPDADGTFVIFNEEAKIKNGCYEFIVRWQMSDQEAAERIREGRDVAANLYSGTVYVNIQTGEMWEEW